MTLSVKVVTNNTNRAAGKDASRSCSLRCWGNTSLKLGLKTDAAGEAGSEEERTD